MSQITAIKTQATEVVWTENKRFFVGETVSYGGFLWVNVTGFNGEPGVSNDWEAYSSLNTSAKENFVAVQDQTVFNLSVIAFSVDVYVNNVYQIENEDYVHAGATITMQYDLNENDIVNVRTF